MKNYLAQSPRWLFPLAIVFFLMGLLYIGFSLRMNGMTSISSALLYAEDYDEGVNVSAGQLFLQGYIPYRDYLFVHPPLAVFLTAAVLKFHYVPWGDVTAFVYERYAAIVAGLLDLLVVFAVSRRLSGTLAALLSVGLLAIDAQLIEIDRRAMLEPYMNLLATLAILCYLIGLENQRGKTRWFWVAGFLGACAGLVKTVGVLSLCAILFYALGRLAKVLPQILSRGAHAKARELLKERFAELAHLVEGALLGVVLITGYSMVTSPTEFIRQVYIFQFFRAPDGIPFGWGRVNDILNLDGSHLTIYLGLAGLAIILLKGALSKTWGRWWLIISWAGAIVILLASSPTFFPHYFVQLAVPLGILSSAVLNRMRRPAASLTPPPRSHRWQRSVILTAQLAIIAFLIFFDRQMIVNQYSLAAAVSQMQSPLLRNVSRAIDTHTTADATILALQPIYPFLASREQAGPQNGEFIIDSYGYLQYVSLGLDADWIPEMKNPALMDLLHGADAQERILGIAARSDDILLERQATWELTPETIAELRRGRAVTFTRGIVTLLGHE